MGKFLRYAVVAVILIGLVVGYYYHLSHRNDSATVEDNATLSEVQAIIDKDLDASYPSTPRAVVKFYNRIMTAYYGLDYSEDELSAMADQALKLFDKDLLNYNPKEVYLASLKIDIDEYKNRNRYIVSTEVSNTQDVKYETINGDECAFVSSYYFVREGSGYSRTYMDFCLRKDAEGKWKILTYQLSDEDTKDEF